MNLFLLEFRKYNKFEKRKTGNKKFGYVCEAKKSSDKEFLAV